MKKYLFLFVFSLTTSSVFAVLDIPGDLKKLPTPSYHRLTSEKRIVGKSSFHWEAHGKLIEFDEDLLIKLTLFKALQTLSTSLVVTTDANLQIQSFTYSMNTPSAVMKVSGARAGSELKLRVEQGGKTQLKTLPLQEPLLVSSTLRPYLLLKGLHPKKENFDVNMFEPSAFVSLPVHLSVSPAGKDRFQVQMKYLDHDLTSQLNSRAELLEEKSDFAGLPVEATPISEKDYASLSIAGSESDLVELAKVNFSSVEHPQTLKKFTVKISGVDLKNFNMNRNRQTFSRGILKVEVEKPFPPTSKPVQTLLRKPEFEKYLAGDATTPVYDPIIQKKAHEIVGTENDLWKRALAIQEFVNSTLKKVATVAIPNALEALETKKGDCKVHSALFTALARAAGVPTRTVVGLVYSEHFYGASGFYYHAWVEVFTGTRWISMDPTWNQAPVDATHLGFVEGGVDQQIQMTSLMGKIKLKAL